jgi:hypothetical protein
MVWSVVASSSARSTSFNANHMGAKLMRPIKDTKELFRTFCYMDSD